MCSVTVFGCFSLSPATSAIGCGFVKYKGADSSFYQLRAVEYNLYSANYLYILYVTLAYRIGDKSEIRFLRERPLMFKMIKLTIFVF